jgi:hypothetical protein
LIISYAADFRHFSLLRFSPSLLIISPFYCHY